MVRCLLTKLKRRVIAVLTKAELLAGQSGHVNYEVIPGEIIYTSP